MISRKMMLHCECNKMSLNVSNLVYLLDTNIRLNTEKIQELFDWICPVEYTQNKTGLIRITCGNEFIKGDCKKLIYRKVNQAKRKKTFRNQIGLYLRICDKEQHVDLKFVEKFNGKHHEDITGGCWMFQKGQTAFQFNKVKIILKKEYLHKEFTFFTDVCRKSHEKHIRRRSFSVTEEDIELGYIEFDFDEISFASAIYFNGFEEAPECYLDFIIELNLFMFSSGKIKLTGCLHEYHIDMGLKCLKESLKMCESAQAIFGVHVDDFHVISKKSIMINTDFSFPFKIKRFELDQIVRQKYNLMSSYEPCSHPACIIRLYVNPTYTFDGTCHCKEVHNSKRGCTGKGLEQNNCKGITVLVFQSGKVILTGSRDLKQVKIGHGFIKNLIERHVSELEFHEK